MKQVLWPMRTISCLFAVVLFFLTIPAAHAQSLSPVFMSFPNTAVTNNSAAKPATFTNSGNAAMSVNVSMIGGDFDQTNNCGTSLASKKSCTINVVFNPTGTGLRAAILEVRAGSGIQLALLTGTAIPQVTLSATSITFASQLVGMSSPATAISLKNNQNIALPMQSVTTTGDFTQTNTCGTSLAAGATCTISVVFKPTAAGTRTGTLAIRDSAVGSPQNIALTGTATAATVKSIAVTPATASIVKGKTQQFTAVVTYTNNTTADVTASATWASSNAAIATVTKGLATGVAVGSATMTASVTGSTVTGTAALTVTAPTLVSIAVTPNPASVVKGKTQQFAATGTYSDGTTQTLTAVTWSSTAGGTITTAGLATATAVGAPTITATSGTISGTAVMTVTPATPGFDCCNSGDRDHREGQDATVHRYRYLYRRHHTKPDRDGYLDFCHRSNRYNRRTCHRHRSWSAGNYGGQRRHQRPCHPHRASSGVGFDCRNPGHRNHPERQDAAIHRHRNLHRRYDPGADRYLDRRNRRKRHHRRFGHRHGSRYTFNHSHQRRHHWLGCSHRAAGGFSLHRSDTGDRVDRERSDAAICRNRNLYGRHYPGAQFRNVDIWNRR